MLRTIYWFVYFWIYQVGSIFFLLWYFILGKLGDQERQEKYLHKVTSKWARKMLWAAGAEVEILGIENIPQTQNALFVSNHQGNFDIPLLLGFIPKAKGFVAKIELSRMPVVSIWMKLLHCIFLDRKNPRQSIQAISKGIEYLKQGRSLVIFPEGTRSKGETMGEFKKGSLKLAVKSNVAVVPITISGSYKLLEQNHFRITPAKVRIFVHPPVDVPSLSAEEKNNLEEMISKKIKEKQELLS